MNATTAELPDLSLPPLNEDIQRALGEVEARLSAFAAAVVQTHAALAAQARRVEAAASPARPQETVAKEPAVDKPVNLSPAVATPKLAESPKNANTTDKSAAAPIADAGESVSTVTSSRLSAPPSPEAQPQTPAAPEAAATPNSTSPAQAEPAAAAPAAHSAAEDEAVLASLDPETAKAIRVMRRLSIEKKSVRQLLKEYQATHNTTAAGEQRKKAWWSRG